MNKSVLVVDDHPLFRKALVSLVKEVPECNEEVLAASTAEEGLQRAREGEVDLILLDLGLPGVAGVDAIGMFRKVCKAPILVVSASEDRHEVDAATRAGASAVVSKSVSMDTLRDTVKNALAGSLPTTKWIRPAGMLTQVDGVGNAMTIRQQEIAALLMDGHSNKEISLRLGVAEITVKTHLTSIFRLLGVINRTQAVLALRKLGLEYGNRGQGRRI
jgi:DNA-binding NarL/FixJ family response regulator